jgi:hypothetical protein
MAVIGIDELQRIRQ